MVLQTPCHTFRAMLQVQRDGPILRATIDRPDVRNAFNDELIDALGRLFREAPTDVRAVVLTGEGSAFCAGGDLQWMRKAASYSQAENEADALRLAGLFEAMVQCHALVIARVNGAAFGGGCGLVAASDVAIAASGAKFAFSEVKLGLVPATISPFVIPKIGPGHARALFATGEVFDAAYALRIGLIHKLGELETLDALVDDTLRAVLAAGPKAVASAKQLAQTEMSPAQTAKLLAEARAGGEGKEGVAAFLEKRKASFVVER